MKFGEVFRFELAYRVSRVSTWLYAVLLLGVPFLLMHAIGGSEGYMNRPHMVAIGSLIAGMLGMLVTAALFGDAATRDVQARMHPLVYTTPLGKVEYLGGRFLAALLVNAVLLLGVPLGLLAGALMPYMDPRMIGPFQAGAYVQPYLLFLLPNLLLTGAILFSIAALTRQMLPAYLGGIGLFIGYLFAADFQQSIQDPTLAALADPFGMATLNRLTSYWTSGELSSRLIGFPEFLLWNRLAWMAVGAAVFGALLLRFRFAHHGGAERRRPRRAKVVEPEARGAAPVSAAAVRGSNGASTRVWQTLSVARRGFEEIARSPAFLVILGGAVLLVFGLGWNVGTEVFGTSTWPVTHLIAGTVLGQAASMVVAALIALFAGELVWRERDVRVAEIADASPTPDWVFLAGRFLALIVLLAAVQTVLLTAGVLLQALQGYHRYELGLYLRILFGLKMVDYTLLAALAMAVHVVVNQKYLGHLIVVLSLVFKLFASNFGVDHNLLLYGSDPGWMYSDLNGFGPFIIPWVWFKLYWAGWALLLAVVARLFWVRGRAPGSRTAQARSRLTGGAAGAAGVAMLLILTLGGFIFYNTNILNEYSTGLEAAAPWAEYERRYKRYENVPQPRILAAQLRVEIYPDENAADLRGSYQLVNRTTQAIDSIHLIALPHVRVRSLSFDRAAERVLDDGDLQYQIYALERPLLPGDSLRLLFDLTIRPRGFPNDGIATAVVRNGTYFDRRWLPIVGYQPFLELKDAKIRQDHGLTYRPEFSAPTDSQALQYREPLRDANLVNVEMVIGTAADQIAVTSGALRREWTENGRRYFHYRSETPIPFDAAVFSARYDVREDRWKNVPLRIYHHPTHTVNLDRMVRSMKASLDYNTQNFGPYPYSELRILECPLYSCGASAHPHTIAFSEGGAFLTRVDEGDIDRPFFVIAHETAHQWWGNQQVSGAAVQGAALISETLAQYSAMMTMEKALGQAEVRRFYDYEMDLYLTSRGVFTNREVPLLEVEGQNYLYYHKGAVAMYTLREQLGEERVNTALRRFLTKYRDAGPPYPTSLDLYAELQAVTPDSLRSLLRDLFEEITLWDVRAEQARVEPASDGTFRVTIEVLAAKVRADSVGTEREVPMDDLVEIGVFGATGEGLGEPLYLRRHRIRSGPQTITVSVPHMPTSAGIDPYGKLIQRESDDNIVNVEESPVAGTGAPNR